MKTINWTLFIAIIYIGIVSLPEFGYADPSASALNSADLIEKSDVCPKKGKNPGLEESFKSIKAAVTSMSTTSDGKTTSPKQSPALPALQSALANYESSRAKCLSSQPSATAGCLTNDNGQLQMAMGMGNELFASGASAVNDSCSKSSKLFALMSTALNGYIAGCEAKKLSCSSSCGKSVAALEQLKVAALNHCNWIDRINPSVASNLCQAELNKLNAAANLELDGEKGCKSVASISRVCSVNYPIMMYGGLQSVKNISDAFKKSSGCDKQSNTGNQPVAVNPSALDVDCTKPANAQNEICICLANPRSVGCDSFSKSGEAYSRSPETTSSAGADLGGGGGDVASISSKDLGAGGHGGISAIEPTGAKDSGSGPRGGGGGGGFGGGSGGGGGSAGDNKAAAAKAGLDTNVLSGESGGMGGSLGFGGGSAALEQAYEKEKEELSDPEKLAAAAWVQQVSPESGRSNFDKVKERYNANRRTLKNQ